MQNAHEFPLQAHQCGFNTALLKKGGARAVFLQKGLIIRALEEDAVC